MPEIMAAHRLARRLAQAATTLDADAHFLKSEGWRVSAQQIRNAVNLLHDVERRLQNGDDWNG